MHVSVGLQPSSRYLGTEEIFFLSAVDITTEQISTVMAMTLGNRVYVPILFRLLPSLQLC